jgi:hypothetical protein
MSESFRLTCCCHGVAPESKLSRTPRQHHSFHGNADIIRGKNIKNMSWGQKFNRSSVKVFFELSKQPNVERKIHTRGSFFYVFSSASVSAS